MTKLLLSMTMNNIRKNRKTIVPFVLSGAFAIFMFYIIVFLSNLEGLEALRGGYFLLKILDLGAFVVGLVSFVFIFYSNSYLFKKRKKEIGLLNTLGLEKRHIIVIFLLEIFLCALASIAGGILLGIFLGHPSVYAIFILLQTSAPEAISMDALWNTVITTALMFFLSFALLAVYYIYSIIRANPIHMLKGGSYGEKEVRHSKIVMILGAALLAGGYIIAVRTTSPVASINLVFLSIFLIAGGTYILFIQMSSYLLKILQKIKSIYYRPGNFITISSLIYRFKQNAAGMASICLLSTAVIVLIAMTSALYMGIEKSVQDYYPKDLSISGKGLSDEQRENIKNTLEHLAAQNGAEIQVPVEYHLISMDALQDKNNNLIKGNLMTDFMKANFVALNLLTTDDYYSITGERISLSGNEAMIFSKSSLVDSEDKSINIFGRELNIARHLDAFDVNDFGESNVFNIYFIIVQDKSAMSALCEAYGAEFSEELLQYCYDANINNYSDEFFDQVVANIKPFDQSVIIGSRQELRSENISIHAGLLAVGIFCSLLFAVATLLIIYYKQISEGYDDISRYEIIRNIGVERKYITKIVRRQIISVFFLPLIVALVHAGFMINISIKILALLGLGSDTLYLICLSVCAAAFSAIYVVMYLATSKVYRGIIRSNDKAALC